MGVTLIYEIEGNKKGETATTSVHLWDGNLLTSLQGFAVAFATILNNFIGGKILRASLNFDVDISGITANDVEVYSDVEEIGGLAFLTIPGTDVFFNVPAVIETVVIDETHELNPLATNVAALISLFEDGLAVTGATIKPCDIGENEVDKLTYAREQWRNSGKRRAS